jgi:hypothetical protein
MNIGIIGGFMAINNSMNASRAHTSRMASMSRMSRMRSSLSTHGSSSSNSKPEQESESEETMIPVSKAKIIAACEFCIKSLNEKRKELLEKYEESYSNRNSFVPPWVAYGVKQEEQALQLMKAMRVCESDVINLSVKDAAFIGDHTKEA